MKPQIIPMETPSLGDRSYLVHDGQVAFVVDPQRDIDRVLALAADLGVQIRHVFETHIHNDYVTGGLALARAVGATYHVSGQDPVSFDHAEIADGDVVEISATMSVRALATPGHTFTHLSYVLVHDGAPAGAFTGGSLLFGSVGRPDLLGPDATGELVRAQYASAHRLAQELPDETQVFPTHGFGSFCSASETEGDSSTIGQERRHNTVLTADEESFVAELLAGLDAYPAYYAHMSPLNLDGPGAPELSLPASVDPAELRRRIEAGEWVVDLRNRTTFAAGHVAGSLNIGLDGSFATYVGWLIPWGTPLTVLGGTKEQVAEAQREVVRIGIDRLAGAGVGEPRTWAGEGQLQDFRTATFAELQEARRSESEPVVLDVRRDLEWTESHLRGAVHIPIHQLLDRLDEVPDGEVWVHCESGYRSSVAASILDRAGRTVVAVDDEYDNAGKAGLEVVKGSDG